MVYEYKLREEKEGASLLDIHAGSAKRLSEAEYLELKQKVLADNKLSQKYKLILPKVPRESLSGLSLTAPARIYFELTRKCNLRCKTCFNESGSALNKELSTEEIFNILAQLNELGTFEIRFTGGEPTYRKDFFDIIKRAKELGFYVSMGTNGAYEGDFVQKVMASGVDWYIVSLDGDEERNDFIRGKGTYTKVLATLKALSAAKKRIRLNMVVGKHNVDCIQTLAKLCDELRIESFNLIPLRPYGRFDIFLKDKMLSSKEFYDFIRLLDELRKRHKVKFVTTLDLLNKDNLSKQDLIVRKEKTCAAGVEGAVISPQGEIYGCSYSPASTPDDSDAEARDIFVAGNLRKRALSDIWLDDKRWAVFRNLDKYKNDKCHSCKYYCKECVGSCPIMSYYTDKTLDSFDPYCFKEIMECENA